MYMLNDLAIEMQRAQSAERHAVGGSGARTERVRGLTWWRRRAQHHRAATRAAQQPIQQQHIRQPIREQSIRQHPQPTRNAPAPARPTADIGS